MSQQQTRNINNISAENNDVVFIVLFGIVYTDSVPECGWVFGRPEIVSRSIQYTYLRHAHVISRTDTFPLKLFSKSKKKIILHW